MSGRKLFWPLLILLMLALGLLGQRARDRWQGSRQLNTVEGITVQASQMGRLDRRILERNLEILRRTDPMLPTEVGVPVARGGQYLLSNRPQAAIRAYQEGLELEPRGEVYANLGRAYLAAGDREEARFAFRRAVLLDYTLAPALQSIMQELSRSQTPADKVSDGS